MNYIISFCLVLLFSGCVYQPLFYQPNTHQIPSLEKAGTGEGSVIFHPDATYAGQFMYSPAKHVLLGGNFYKMTKGIRENYQPWTTGNYLELGTGGYMKYHDLVLSLTGWFGRGGFYNRFSSKADSRNTFLKSTCQAGVALRHKNIHLGLGLRLGHLFFNTGTISLDADEESFKAFQAITSDKRRWFGGAAFSVGLGLEPLYFSFQILQEIQFGHTSPSRLQLEQSGAGVTMRIPISKK
jgi:hypothetical protein